MGARLRRPSPIWAKCIPACERRSSVDGFPGRTFRGWVGFISPVAEFTPKTVQTTELRTSLVYEVRVFVQRSGGRLRLGMPATVHLPLGPKAPVTPEARAMSEQRATLGRSVWRARICASRLQARTGEIVQALDDVSFKAAPGHADRAGRSGRRGQDTLMRLVAGLLTPDAGDLQVLGIDVAADPQRSRTASATCRSGSVSTRT